MVAWPLVIIVSGLLNPRPCSHYLDQVSIRVRIEQDTSSCSSCITGGAEAAMALSLSIGGSIALQPRLQRWFQCKIQRKLEFLPDKSLKVQQHFCLRCGRSRICKDNFKRAVGYFFCEGHLLEDTKMCTTWLVHVELEGFFYPAVKSWIVCIAVYVFHACGL